MSALQQHDVDSEHDDGSAVGMDASFGMVTYPVRRSGGTGMVGDTATRRGMCFWHARRARGSGGL